MDLQSALMVGGVTVAVCAVLILVSLFRTSGTSYEEAVAEQRRATSELLALAGAGTKQALKKSKKAGKKAKDKKQKEVATGSERESDVPADSGQEEDSVVRAAPAKPHVEFKETIIVDVPLDKPIKTQIRKRGREPKVKPILLNKEDVSRETSAPPTPVPAASNHFEEIHPKDECELMHAHLADKAEKKDDIVEKKDAKPVKSGKGKGKQAAPAHVPTPVSAEEPATEVVVEEPAFKETNSGDFAKEQRKTKKTEKRPQMDDSGDKLPREESSPPPLNLPQPSDLTTDKILRQIAQPVAAPGPAPAKPKKNKKLEQNVMSLVGSDVGGVNVSELVRLVSEAVLSRTEIQILTDALLNKQHGVLPQHGEWSEGPNDPVQKLKKQLAEKEKALADEQEASQAVHAKLKELRASLNTERARATALARSAEEVASNNKVEVHTLQARMQRLLDDNQQLAQEKHLLQTKLQADSEAAAQRFLEREMHNQRQLETEQALMSQLGALQAELGARVLEVGQARCEAAAARDANLQVQQHAAELAQQLQEANRVCSELESARASLCHAEQAAGAELRTATERIAELQAEVQRLSRAEHTAAQVERTLEEADRQNRQLSNEIKSLREQLAAKDEEIKKEHTSHQQNGLPPPEDVQKKQELSKLEGVVETLRSELAAALASHAEQQRQLATLQSQLNQYRDKNNELRTKNWKVMEALQAAERALQTKAGSPAQAPNHEAVVKALEKQSLETAEVLRAACPQVAPPGAADAKWLATFADQLSTVLRAAGTDRTVPQDGMLKELRGQNAHLQELVDKYKKIIDDTEGALGQLQHNVTTEEQRWEHLLQEKQRELDRLQRTTVTQMQSKIDALQAELERSREVRAAGQHSLVDMERGNEEMNRLLSLTEKHQRESLNGPSQVGFEEK